MSSSSCSPCILTMEAWSARTAKKRTPSAYSPALVAAAVAIQLHVLAEANDEPGQFVPVAGPL